VWTYYGDALLNQGDSEGALKQYAQAISLDACAWTAHRFTADVLIKTGELEAAQTAAAHAVACNPEYTTAWATVDRVAIGRGGRLLIQSPLSLPTVETGEDGSPLVLLPDGLNVGSPDGAAWQAYALIANVEDFLSALISQGGLEVSFSSSASPLGQQRSAVQAGLDIWVAPETGSSSSPWSVLAAAQEAERLDAAILVLFLDEDLLPEFIAFREAHLDVMVAFVSENLVDVTAGSR
jgi:tetratricopeptide (TPR) repeat protein